MSKVYDLSDLADLKPIEVPFSYGGRSYVLREATEDVVLRYNRARMKDSSYSNDDPEDIRIKLSLPALREAQAVLVGGCLYDQEGRQVGDIVRGWPSKVIQRLFPICEEISELSAPEKEQLERQIEESKRRLELLDRQQEIGPKNAQAAIPSKSE